MAGSRKEAIAARRREATQARLADLGLPASGAWARAVREDALARLTAAGLPLRQDEYWKFTNPADLVAPAVPAAALGGDDARGMLFAGFDALRIVFVDGVFDAEASDALAQEGLEIERLAVAGARDIHWAKEIYGKLETRGQTPVARPFAALNTALASDGVVIRATRPVSRPVSLTYLRRDPQAEAFLHHVIRIEAGASLTLLENGAGAARFSVVTEVDVAADGAFHHIRAQGRDHERRGVTHMFARLAERSVAKTFTLATNGRLTRNEVVAELTGREGVVHIAGAAVGDGTDFHQDDTVFVTHAAERCESRQVFKKVLRRGAVGVFQGKILVHPQAQLTDGYQISQALMLDETCQFLAKPELEIYADDVKCSHGSTSGAIDPVALHYLRSRGLRRGEAERLLVLAFLAEALDEIEDANLAEDVRDRLGAWLERHGD